MKQGIMNEAEKSRQSSYQRRVHNLSEIPNEAFFTTKELADTLKFNIMTIYRYIDAKKIKAHKIGKEYRINKKDFEMFLNSVKTK